MKLHKNDHVHFAIHNNISIIKTFLIDNNLIPKNDIKLSSDLLNRIILVKYLMFNLT